MLDFDTAVNLFKDDKIRELSTTEEGMRFLKLRSLSRKNFLDYLISKFNKKNNRINTNDKKLRLLYESDDIHSVNIDDVIKELYREDRKSRLNNEEKLINELYKVQSFGWGGLHQNSLETTIINNYVKKITSYELLTEAIESDLHNSLRSYVLASWYNHWTSIIIEDVFKEHLNVVPAIGQIKKIDFFIHNKPFDLKVTYLPEGYIKEYRKKNGLRPELTLMKRKARELNIGFDDSVPESALIPDLWRKLDDNPSDIARELICELHAFREELLNLSIANPEVISRWFYENQGDRRFDASNRLFLVLVDKTNFFDSWKLKRARPLISTHVTNYLEKVNQDIGFQLDFNWKENTYSTEADVIFVIKQ